MDSDSTPSIEVTIEAPGWRAAVTDPETFCSRVTNAVLNELLEKAACPLLRPQGPTENGAARRIELGILLADDAAVRALNREWRGIDKATNVLSFPGDSSPVELPPDAPWLLGDIVIALETVQREAAAAHKPLVDHLTHLLVHGILHLLGHDHELEAEALRMEELEVELLARLGVPDPYAPDSHTEVMS